ncbi:MAG: Lar family restriction alleviation protein [Burkholderiales bacterium]|jgi:Lar family restriction alleviation protein
MRPCPFCGRDEIQVLALSDEPGDLIVYVCQYCGAVGPAEFTQEGAQQRWEARTEIPRWNRAPLLSRR